MNFTSKENMMVSVKVPFGPMMNAHTLHLQGFASLTSNLNILLESFRYFCKTSDTNYFHNTTAKNIVITNKQALLSVIASLNDLKLCCFKNCVSRPNMK